MKKIMYISFLVLFSAILLLSTFNHEISPEVKTYFNVYFKGEIIGKVKSKNELISYIEKDQNKLKEIYSVDNVYVPNDINIEKIIDYQAEVDNIKDVYNKISEMAPFTINGFEVVINNEESNEVIYVTKREILDRAIENVIDIFVGQEPYKLYKNSSQKEITDTGSYINSVYLDNNITIKEAKISVKEKIFSSDEELTKYFMYGNNQSKKYITSIGDTLESIAFKNEINVEELIIANPSFSSTTSLTFPGQEVIINILEPKLKVTVEQKVTEKTPLQYKTIETIDENKIIGYTSVVQQGEEGVLKVTQLEKIVNGTTVYVEPMSQEVIKPAVDKIVIKGGKKVSGVGSLTDWAWPTNNGWTITSRYGYRINPVTYKRELHGAIDIAGTGYGSPIYAANNGVIWLKEHMHKEAGNYIVINHNNGYYTQYNHMSRFADVKHGQVVEKGQIIGYIGSTGQSTGPHLHYAVWVGRPWGGGTRINPLNLYK